MLTDGFQALDNIILAFLDFIKKKKNNKDRIYLSLSMKARGKKWENRGKIGAAKLCAKY